MGDNATFVLAYYKTTNMALSWKKKYDPQKQNNNGKKTTKKEIYLKQEGKA